MSTIIIVSKLYNHVQECYYLFYIVIVKLHTYSPNSKAYNFAESGVTFVTNQIVNEEFVNAMSHKKTHHQELLVISSVAMFAYIQTFSRWITACPNYSLN